MMEGIFRGGFWRSGKYPAEHKCKKYLKFKSLHSKSSSLFLSLFFGYRTVSLYTHTHTHIQPQYKLYFEGK